MPERGKTHRREERMETDKSANARTMSQEKTIRYTRLHLLLPPPFLPPRIPRTPGWGSEQFHFYPETQDGPWQMDVTNKSAVTYNSDFKSCSFFSKKMCFLFKIHLENLHWRNKLPSLLFVLCITAATGYKKENVFVPDSG